MKNDLPPLCADPMEAWFSQVVPKGGCTPAHLAEALQEDGVPEHQAWLMAAAAFIRYHPAPVGQMLESTELRSAMSALRRHLGGALHERHNPHERATPVVLDPLALHVNQLQPAPHGPVVLQFVSHSPRAALFGNVFSAQECAGLIALAQHQMRDSEVVDTESKETGVDKTTRSSTGTFLDPGRHALLDALLQRVAGLLQCPLDHFEPVAITHYVPGAEFLEHTDYLDNNDGKKIFGPEGDRIATLVVYLNDVAAGGATTFPEAGIEVRPQRGSGIYFAYQHADRSLDAASLHAGAPTTEGDKWIATFWLHERSHGS